MTETEQHQTWLTFNAFQAKIENKFIPLVKKPMEESVNAYVDRGMKGDLNIASKLVPVFSNMYYQCGYGYGNHVYRQYKNVKVITTPEDIAREVLNELRLSLMTNVNGIEATVKEAILEAIQKGESEGWAFDKTAATVKNIINIARAQRIVRTESVKASNLAATIGAQRTGLLMDKVWISARDIRTRGNPAGPMTEFDHYDMNGQIVPMDRPFFLGSRTGFSDELMFPGDPKGQPADIINCRCVVGFKPRRDANGRAIRVRPQNIFAGSAMA